MSERTQEAGWGELRDVDDVEAHEVDRPPAASALVGELRMSADVRFVYHVSVGTRVSSAHAIKWK